MFFIFSCVLLIILVLLVPAGRKTLSALREARRALRWRRGLTSPRTSGFDELPLGEVALRGRVVPIDPLR